MRILCTAKCYEEVEDGTIIKSEYRDVILNELDIHSAVCKKLKERYPLGEVNNISINSIELH